MKVVPINTEKDFYEIFLDDLINDSCAGHKNIIYRGQTDNGWGLIPNIHRTHTFENWAYDFWGTGEWSTNDKALPPNSLIQAQIENTLLSRFLQSIEESNYSIPELNFKKNIFGWENLYSFQVNENDTYPNKKYEDLTAIAQHYGIPTRMLDWSKDYLVSLYFALQPSRYGFSHFSVFSLDTNVALSHIHPNSIYNQNSTSFHQEAFEFRNAQLGFLNIIYAPTHLCPNMKAQKGCLTYLNNTAGAKLNYHYDLIEYFNNLDRVNNEAMKLVHGQDFETDNQHPVALKKYVFHPALAKFVMKWLYVHNINEGTIFPDLNGIASNTKQIVRRYKYFDK
jgi:hypothetical protein